MCLWAEALDIAHATRMKIDSEEPPCRGVTAFGNLFGALVKALPNGPNLRRYARFVNSAIGYGVKERGISEARGTSR